MVKKKPHRTPSNSNSEQIKIREDKWLRKSPIGGPATRGEPLKVASLIMTRDGKWNEPLINSMSDDQIARAIFSTPIGLPNIADGLAWTNTKSRNYTVKKWLS